MTTSLIITAHPSPDGFTHQISARVGERRRAAGHIVEEIKLYSDDPLSFLRFDSKDEIGADEGVLRYQEQVARADEIFFIFPCWWGDCPSIMRNWFDLVFAKGFAFEYTQRRPVGLLQNKVCSVIMTTGTPARIYNLLGVTRSMRRIWNTTRIKFCGMRLKAFLVVGGMDTRNRDEIGALARVDKLLHSRV